MGKDKVIWNREIAENHSLDLVGGKGKNLLELYKYSLESGLFIVPNFFIIPTDVQTWNTWESDIGEIVSYNSNFVEEAFEKLSRPVVVRSSSPLEDGVNASFAGQFLTLKNINNIHELYSAIARVKNSALKESVEEYAEDMGFKLENYLMPVIIQEQVSKNSEKTNLQLEEDIVIIDTFHGENEASDSSHEFSYEELDNLFPDSDLEKYSCPTSQENSLFNLPHIGEGQCYYALQVARRAKKALGLEGTVQVEAFLNGRSLPAFVQIRQLPKIKIKQSSSISLSNLSISEGMPYMESKVCNGVPCDISLPAYVTFSQSGFKGLLIETGQGNLIGLGRGETDERAEIFRKNSKLAINKEFFEFVNLAMYARFGGLGDNLHLYNHIWQKGNNLFDEYALVCDKLDETIVGMTTVTKNKKAIITCNEESRTSHAMTVARDLGIPAIGLMGDFYELQPRFYHEVETGDIIRIKSDGRRAIAYIEKKRDKDPYEKD